MFRLLRDIYDRADTECNVAISFNHDKTGAQQNACREFACRLCRRPNLDLGTTNCGTASGLH